MLFYAHASAAPACLGRWHLYNQVPYIYGKVGTVCIYSTGTGKARYLIYGSLLIFSVTVTVDMCSPRVIDRLIDQSTPFFPHKLFLT